LGPRATVTQSVELHEYSDVTLRVETPGYEDGTDVVVDVVDEGTALLACARNESTKVHNGAVTVVLPVEGTGLGALHMRLGFAGGAVHYLVPTTVTAEGELVATLLLPT
jgi:hypothetical protein